MSSPFLPDPYFETRIKKPQKKARAAALRLLAFRPRTIHEMRERLAQKVGAAEADLTVQQLQAEGLLNDAHFANQWRESRERHRPRGRKILRQELRRRGVADDVIEGVLADFNSDEVAYRAGLKYASKQTSCDERTFRRRLGAFLHRRGFEPDIIRRAVDGLNEELRGSGSD